ncbi:TM1802 family CRISPR-associated protein [uncultured Campylobacter sp.]|uniref:TM1802 family CRISPR-associated protein n=1 Tax=uncultured Campylobacter sp. TaxID=218934 RepID=UPI0026037252|nr:TM1802 family CRISPR-associated protein [uncultured Campylobacter sp.]
MGLVHKLYNVGSLLSDDSIIAMIKSSNFKDSDHKTLVVDFKIENGKLIGHPEISIYSLDNIKTFFTKKIGGTSNSYYLYPNFEYQGEKDLYKKFKAISHTLQNSAMIYANDDNKRIAALVFEYIKNYENDELELKNFKQDDYFLVLLINGKSFFELMPEILQNYLNEFVRPHIKNSKNEPLLKELADVVTKEKIACGYNPDIKFFTMDNYDDSYGIQQINKLPMSLESAKTIKKGWMFAINNLKFYYKGLEYIIIPSMANFDAKIFKGLISFLKNAKNMQEESEREESFMRRLRKQIENYDQINSFTLDILFAEVDQTNLSVKIFSTLEDVLPSRIAKVVKLMQERHITDSSKQIQDTDDDIKFTYLKDYFGVLEKYAVATRVKGLDNKIMQEKIFLAKLLLGYAKIKYIELLKRFEHFREFDAQNKKKIKDGVKNWIAFPENIVENENKILGFLQEINAIRM